MPDQHQRLDIISSIYHVINSLDKLERIQVSDENILYPTKYLLIGKCLDNFEYPFQTENLGQIMIAIDNIAERCRTKQETAHLDQFERLDLIKVSPSFLLSNLGRPKSCEGN